MEDIQKFIEVNPHYGYLIVASLLLLYLVGLILDWDWTVEPGGGYFNIAFWIDKLGRKTVRIILGTIAGLGFLAVVALFFDAMA